MDIKTRPDEFSPVTGRLTVLVDHDPATGLISKLCMETGYSTNSFLRDGSKTVENLPQTMPKVAIEAMVVDNVGNVWVPMTQATEAASIYPYKQNETDEQFVWAVTPIKKLSDEEAQRYPNPEKPGEFMDSYVDFDNSEYFPFGEFEKAFNLFVEWSVN